MMKSTYLRTPEHNSPTIDTSLFVSKELMAQMQKYTAINITVWKGYDALYSLK